MGVFDDQLILPGAITEIESDYNFGYDTSLFGTTDAVTIIGTAFNGPVGKPIPIYSPEHAKYVFGNSYDYSTRREATLVAGIQDTWDTGCRTIYAVRLSGLSIAKDFQLAVDSNLKLRVSGLFPSNSNKDIYMTYDATTGAEKIVIYKPANRATINEKMQGIVEKEDSIITAVFDLNGTYGITKDSRLVELVNVINQYADNNVIRLSIVDETGSDVTISSKEAQALSVGVLFPGAYFIGRDANLAAAETDLQFIPVLTDADKPFDSFDGKLYKRLDINTDVSADLPIYVSTVELFNKKIAQTGVQMSVMFDFLSVPGKVDAVFKKDAVDYEEVDIEDFEVYKRLGSGFAIAAKAVDKVSGHPEKGIKVIEAPVSDPNRIVPIEDGIYSMLENVRTPYRVLMNGAADKAITGKIPRKNAFEIAIAKEFSVMAGFIKATAKVDKADLSEPKKYAFSVKELDPLEVPTTFAQVYMASIAKRVGLVASAADITAMADAKDVFPNGTLFLATQGAEAILYRVDGGEFVEMKDPAVYANLNGKLLVAKVNGVDKVFKGFVDNTVLTDQFIAFKAVDRTQVADGSFSFMLVESQGIVAVYALATDGSVTPIGEISAVFSDEEDKNLVTVQSEYAADNDIVIKSSALDYLTLEEFVESLNEDKDLSRFFSFEIAADHVADKDEYVQDILVKDFDATVSYVTGNTVMFNGVEYIAKTDVAAGAFVVSTDPLSGFRPVDDTMKVWAADTDYLVGDIVISTDTNPKPYICLTAHHSVVGATFADDALNFAPIVYKEEKTLSYDKSLYIAYKTTDDFARHLAQHCTVTSLKNSQTHGILGCDRLLDVNINSVAAKVNKLLAMDVNYYAKKANGRDMLDKNNLPYPIGRCVSVVFGQYVVVDDATAYNFISNGAAGYAGMVSQLPLEQSSTNQTISIPTPMFDLTNFQLQRLTQKGFITFKNSFTGGYVVTDGITMAPTDSAFRRLSVSRIINEMEKQINIAVQPFIGKQNHLANRNSMQTAIKSKLEAMKGTLLEKYDFKLLVDPSSQRLGIVYIDYNVTPVYEIRQVISRLSIKES